MTKIFPSAVNPPNLFFQAHHLVPIPTLHQCTQISTFQTSAFSEQMTPVSYVSSSSCPLFAHFSLSHPSVLLSLNSEWMASCHCIKISVTKTYPTITSPLFIYASTNATNNHLQCNRSHTCKFPKLCVSVSCTPQIYVLDNSVSISFKIAPKSDQFFISESQLDNFKNSLLSPLLSLL